MKGQRYDLTKWTYTQLRDFINTSTDIDMIQSCRDEFARRLSAYHNWRAKVRTNSFYSFDIVKLCAIKEVHD